MTAHDPLSQYKAKRDFLVTLEPTQVGSVWKDDGTTLSFVVHKHWASSLHYDFRLELGGTLKSWAVPKGPSLDPTEKRLAVQVEDHPLGYAAFEGVIPAGQYGAGRVVVWDKGYWQPSGDPVKGLKDGNLKFELVGNKLAGKWALVRIKRRSEPPEKQNPWLLIKEKDGFARAHTVFNVTEALPDRVANALALPIAKQSAKSAISDEEKAFAAASVSALPGAVKSALPAKLSPQLATLLEQAPADLSAWLYEIKLDGYRLLARVQGAAVRLFTRNGHDWTHKLAAVVRSRKVSKLPTGWYDGELVVLNAQGVPDFGALQAELEQARGQDGAALVYYLFDMPFSGGYDLRHVRLIDRRAALRAVLSTSQVGMTDAVRFSHALDAPGGSVLAAACQLGLEGVIGKRWDSPYREARSLDWIKLKCQQRQEFVINGYTAPLGSRQGLGALLLGVHDANGQLLYAGKVGTGFDDKSLRSLHTRLAAMAVRHSPFSAASPISGKPHWVAPTLVAEVRFGEWTRAGHVRHAVFVALRDDKDAAAVARETSQQVVAPFKGGAVFQRATTAVTHADRIIDATTGLTKGELVAYYDKVAKVADLMLPDLRKRPVALVRVPQGISGTLFFQKHADTDKLPGVRQLDTALFPAHPPLLCVTSARGVLAAAQFNVVEFHTMNTGIATLHTPDRLVLDLDPGEGVAWAAVQQAALLVRVLLQELKLLCFLKTSGGKGLHVVVPLKKIHTWQMVRGFSQALVVHLAATIPHFFVAKSGPKNRVGKIYVDYLRNGFGATTACAWSARARPGMGVSVRVAWEELGTLRGGNHWTIRTVDERLAVGNTPWAGYARSRQTLTAAIKVFQPSKA